MSFFNPTARVTVNKQLSFEYAMYMVFGSYFKSTKCSSSTREISMRINYIETKESLQYEMEDICDVYADKVFSGLHRPFHREDVIVSFVPRSDGRQEVDFWGKGFVLRLIGNYSGKGKSLIKAEYRERRGAS